MSRLNLFKFINYSDKYYVLKVVIFLCYQMLSYVYQIFSIVTFDLFISQQNIAIFSELCQQKMSECDGISLVINIMSRKQVFILLRILIFICHVSGLLLCHLEPSQSCCFRSYRKRPVEKNGLR